MKKHLLLVAFAVACANAHAETPAGSAASTVPSSAVKSELMGFDSVFYGGQQVSIAVTKETTNGVTAFCRQTVESYTHEIVPGDNSGSSLPVDKTTIVLGKQCRWAKG